MTTTATGLVAITGARRPVKAAAAGGSAQSGEDRSSWLETKVIGEGTIKFWRKISGEGILYFTVDSYVEDSPSGPTGWQGRTITIEGLGMHTLKWSYSGNSSAFIDYVRWTGTTETSQPLQEALDVGWPISTTEDSNGWSKVSYPAYNDGDSAKSGDIEDDEVSQMQAIVEGEGTVKFWWKVSSEEGNDELEFYIDGVFKNKISGEQDWDGFTGLGQNETVDALNASMDRAGQLYIESSNSWWEGGFSPLGPFLYKIVAGDFVATVEVTDFAGEEGAVIFHNDSFLMARVPNLDDGGPGEDFECTHYFPTWVGNMGRDYNNGSETEWGFTGDGFDCARYIQLERVNNTFYFRRSFDGQAWTELAGSPLTREDLDGLALQVGVGHSIYSTDTGYAAFDNFRLEGPDVSVGKSALPNPSNGATDLPRDTSLSWKPGIYADKHDVYFGTDVNDVNEASTTDPRGVLVGENQESEIYDPGLLDFNQTYYWRVDEVNDAEPNSPWKGNVWVFTTVNFIVVEDFEDYNDFEPYTVYFTWIDGWDDPANGATAGYPNPIFGIGEHYMETTIVYSGAQSMPLFYDNSAGLSEVTRTLNADWTQDDVVALMLFYYGDASNAIEPMYVALNGSAVVNHDNPNAAQTGRWTEWTIDLQAFADQGVNLTNVDTISLGLGNKNNPLAGGSGMMYFDDIHLHPPAQ